MFSSYSLLLYIPMYKHLTAVHVNVSNFENPVFFDFRFHRSLIDLLVFLRLQRESPGLVYSLERKSNIAKYLF